MSILNIKTEVNKTYSWIIKNIILICHTVTIIYINKFYYDHETFLIDCYNNNILQTKKWLCIFIKSYSDTLK